MQLKKLLNKSPRPQGVVFRGRQVVLPADGIAHDYAEEIADLLLNTHPDFVEEVVDIGGVAELAKDDSVWVANITGDIDAPARVKAKRTEKGHWVEIDVDNPVKAPRTVTRTMKGGMKEVMGKSGLEGLNLLPVPIKVPPYKRVKLPKHVAKWFLGRINSSGLRDCIRSRAPAEFEPDPSWTIDDLRFYLQLLDPSLDSSKVGPTESKIKKKMFGSGVKGKANLNRELTEHKERLLKRIFRRVADPIYRQPSKAEFDEYKAAQLGLDPDPEDVTPASESSAESQPNA